MESSQPVHHVNARLQSTGWIIDARWYYICLSFVLVLIARSNAEFEYTTIILAISMIMILFGNRYFYLFLRRANIDDIAPRTITLLNIGQIAVDLLFFFVVMLFTGGGVESIAHSFFFIPIIAAMILFGYSGAITVAVISGFLVLLSVLLHVGALNWIMTPGESLAFNKTLSLALTQSGIIFLIYLLAGYYCGYVSRLIKTRDLELLEQINKEAGHVHRLEELTDEFDKSAKLLVRRDLELSNAYEKLTQLDKMKSEIISIVAHQLRTPLSAIKWTLKMLIDGDAGQVTAEQKDLLSKGFDSNERMITLINDMLEVDRLESGKLKYNFIPVQFEDLVREMIGELLPLATQKKVRIELSSPREPLPKIKVDPDKIHDVLQNLIDNAIKYTKEGGIVAVSVSMEGKDLHFAVKDNGIGIPDAEKGKIFSRFFRAINAIRTETDGSGLGLFIAESIVKRHAGKIWFESTINVGTTFHITLPFSP